MPGVDDLSRPRQGGACGVGLGGPWRLDPQAEGWAEAVAGRCTLTTRTRRQKLIKRYLKE